MAKRNEDVPRHSEVLSQLERMLASVYFKTSDTQSKLLSFVVRKAIEKETIKEANIGFAIFENYDPESHKVRSNASLVRDKIRDYYKDEGKDDFVRIDFPPGPAYRPEFFYNIETEALRAYKRALAYQKRLSVFALSEAEILLDRSINRVPEYAPSHAAKAETFLLRLILDNIIEVRPGSIGWVGRAYDSAEDAVRLDPNSWLGHIVLGVVRLSAWSRKGATKEFSVAMEIDPGRTKASLWYCAYLMTIGRIDEALQLAKSKAADDMGSFEIRLVCALFLYVARSYEDAHNMLHQVGGLELGEPLQQLLDILIDLATGQRLEVVPNGLKVISGNIFSQWELPGTSTLMRRSDINRPGEIEPKKFRMGDSGSFFIKPPDNPGQRFPGLEILSLATAGLAEEANEKMAALRKQKRVKSLQLALGYMGVGNEARALASLWRAYREGDIFTNWLHLLPFFDPLRKHPRFQELVDAMPYYWDEIGP